MKSLGNQQQGILVNNVPANTIGSEGTGARNIISGNSDSGIWIIGASAVGNVVAGNYIGTDVTGTAALGNGVRGVAIDYGANQNTVGGADSNARNVISANGWDGVYVAGDVNGANMVLGNYIGIDASGSHALGNHGCGVRFLAGGIPLPGTLPRRTPRKVWN